MGVYRLAQKDIQGQPFTIELDQNGIMIPAGFDLIAAELGHAPGVRILLGAEPQGEWERADKAGGIAGQVASTLAAERDLTGFTLEADRQARALVSWLAAATANGMPRVEVRRYTKGFLHGKAFLARNAKFPCLLAGSSNLTLAGLSWNRELNLGYPTGEHAQLVFDWFDELWQEAEPFDLAGFYAARWAPHAPWSIFMRMLYELYGDEVLRQKAEFRTALKLTGFQLDGVERASRIMERLGGVLVCDEVGLGKTFIAGELIHRATFQNRQEVLCVVPAALKDTTWLPFLKKFDISRRVEVVTYDQLRLGDVDAVQHLDRYALIVIDEAHNLRNAATDRARSVLQLLGGAYRKQVVLLTATPVNNSLNDLHTLVSYFVRNDAEFASLGIPSIAEYIKRAMSMDPESLSPEHLFDLMDQVAVRRTRRFIRDTYVGDLITAPDGEEKAIEFPTPRLYRIDYRLGWVGDALLDALVYALDDPRAEEDPKPGMRERLLSRCDDPKRLSMARYIPSLFALDKELELRQVSASALLESALLKRFESSAVALRHTLQKLIISHETFLRALESGKVISGQVLNDFSTSDEEFETFLETLDDARLEENVLDAAAFDVEALQERVEQDRALLYELELLAGESTEEGDPKVEELLIALENIATAAMRPSPDGIKEGDRRKVVVFSTFADTIAHVHSAVEQSIAAKKKDSPLNVYKNRIAKPIFGSKHGTNQEERAGILAHFVPYTAGTLDAEGKPLAEDLYDILFATDVLSEGVNLQQAGNIINMDLPWNPMRLVQRHGRLDRLFSHHKEIGIGCFFPAENLNRLLLLEEKLQRKVAYANAAIGVGHVLPGQIADPGVEMTLNDLREQIQAIHAGDIGLFESRGGSAALSGEEYRQRLEKVIRNHGKEELMALPFGSGSGFVNCRAKKPGWVFCARISAHDKPWFRFVVAEENSWKPVLDTEGNPWILDDTLTSLVAADPEDEHVDQVMPQAALENVYDAWGLAQAHIHAAWTRLTDPASLQPEIPRALRDAAALVYEHGDKIPELDQQDLLKRLNAKWDNAVIKEVREILRSDASPMKKVRELASFVQEAGLEPVIAAQPLDPVSLDEIRLVCWMAVGAGGNSYVE